MARHLSTTTDDQPGERLCVVWHDRSNSDRVCAAAYTVTNLKSIKRLDSGRPRVHGRCHCSPVPATGAYAIDYVLGVRHAMRKMVDADTECWLLRSLGRGFSSPAVAAAQPNRRIVRRAKRADRARSSWPPLPRRRSSSRPRRSRTRGNSSPPSSTSCASKASDESGANGWVARACLAHTHTHVPTPRTIGRF